MKEREISSLMKTTAELRETLMLFRQTQEAILGGNAAAISSEFSKTTEQLKEWASGQKPEETLRGLAGSIQARMRTAIESSITQSMAAARAGSSAFGALEQIGEDIAKKLVGPSGAAVLGLSITVGKLYESYRMLGAKYARVLTAGHGEQDETYAAAGNEIVRSVNAIRMQTGAGADAVFTTMETLSRMGMVFDEDTKKAIRFSQSMDTVLNVVKGTGDKFLALGVGKYGEDWSEVAKAIERVGGSTDYFLTIAKETGNAQARVLSAAATQTSVLSDVLSATVKTNIDISSLTDTILAGTNILYKTGTRTGLMTAVLGQMVSGLAPSGNTGYNDTINQSVLLKFLLYTHGDEESRVFYRSLQDQMSKQGMDRDLVAVAVSQNLANDNTGDFFRKYFDYRSRGFLRIGTESGTPGDARLRQYWFGSQLQGLGMRASMLQQRLFELYQQQRQKGVPEANILQTIAQSSDFAALQKEPQFAGKSVNDIFRELSGQGPAMLSAQEKIQMWAESLISWHDTYWPTYRIIEPGIVQQELRYLAGMPGGPVVSQQRYEKLLRKNLMLKTGERPITHRYNDITAVPTGRGRRLLVSSTLVRTANGVEHRQIYYKNDVYAELRQKHAALSGIPELEPLMREIERRESGFNPNIRNSSKGAIGMAQIMPSNVEHYRNEVAQRLGIPPEKVDPHRAEDSIAIQSMLMRDLAKQYGNNPHKIARRYYSSSSERTSFNANYEDDVVAGAYGSGG